MYPALIVALLFLALSAAGLLHLQFTSRVLSRAALLGLASVLVIGLGAVCVAVTQHLGSSG